MERTDLVVAGVGLVGVVVGSCIPLFGEWIKSHLQRRKDGSYAAIRLICLLEEYADKCIEVCEDDGDYVDGDQWGYLEPMVPQPDPPKYPDDINWRSLKEEMTHRLLSLPNLARSTDKQINIAFYHSNPPDRVEGFAARGEGYARLGHEASRVIAALKKEYSIKSRTRTKLSQGLSPSEHLQGLVEEYDAIRKREKAESGE